MEKKNHDNSEKFIVTIYHDISIVSPYRPALLNILGVNNDAYHY